ncbi:MAG: hypothetical protein DMF93_25520 [Acidobacteria bacterium]|nr:MAG: hypothetical protein DMF93_25520 [Acidobacteriota bacterium]
MIRALPGFTSRIVRAGKSVSDAASAASRAGPRAAKRTMPSTIAAAAASSAARRSARAETIVSTSIADVRRAVSASIASANAGGALLRSATSTAVTRRSSSDGARSSMKRAIRASFGARRSGHRQTPSEAAATASAAPASTINSAGAPVVHREATMAAPIASAATSDPRTTACSAHSARHRARTASISWRIWE